MIPAIERPILTTDGTLLYGDTGSSTNIYTLDGELLSSTPHPGGSGGNRRSVGLILNESKLFVPSGSYVYAYDVSDSKAPDLLWQVETRTSSLVSGMSVDNSGDVYLSHSSEDYETNLYRLDGLTGEVVWSGDTYDPRMIKPSFAESVHVFGNQLFVDALYNVLAYDLETGEKLWVSDGLVCGEAEWEFADGLVFANNALYRNCAGGAAVLAVNATSGESS